MSVTLGTIVNRVQRKVDNVEGGRRVQQKEIIDEVNEAVRQVVQRIAAVWPEYYLRTSQTQKAQSNIVADTANYDLPAGMYLIIMVTDTDSDGDTTRVEPITLIRTLDSDAVGYYLMDDDIYLYPTRDTSVANGLTIYYIDRPSEVTSLTGAVAFADDWQDEIAAWATTKIRAGQNNQAADFATVHAMIQSHADAMVVRTNVSEGQGPKVLWRNWI